MNKSKNNNGGDDKKKTQYSYEDELFKTGDKENDELESDGSASAFDETESVNEDNFDNLSEK
jgi:hypothetical protein